MLVRNTAKDYPRKKIFFKHWQSDIKQVKPSALIFP